MDPNKFTSPTGELVQIERLHKPDWAFVPAPMPPDWQFPNHLWPVLVEAKECLGRLDGIGRTLQNPELLLTPLRNREALTSSSLEGTYVSAEQLLLFGLDTKESESEERSEWREVMNYNRALQRGIEMLEEYPFCLGVIREMHKSLLLGIGSKTQPIGQFREWQQVQIGSTARFIPPPANRVPELMENLEQYINSEDSRYDPLVRCYVVHYQFEAIHPFEDGNGRIGRVLLALMVQKWLNHKLPWLYMSAFYERYKDEYIDNLFRISTEGSWDKWIEFCLIGTIQQANDAIRRCDKFDQLKRAFHESAQYNSSARTHQIIESLFEQPFVTVTRLAENLNISYPTARKDIDRLIDLGILSELDGLYPKTFYSPKVFRIAYGEPEEITGEMPMEAE